MKSSNHLQPFNEAGADFFNYLQRASNIINDPMSLMQSKALILCSSLTDGIFCKLYDTALLVLFKVIKKLH